MKKETAGEVIGNPLWFTPVMLMLILCFIEGVHTVAHWHMEIDVHGYCTRNKEYLEKKDSDYDY
tara:strand:+ start:2506 stop:2697 length:192 start_codon:yes stop_codon:yes gene_type:complete